VGGRRDEQRRRNPRAQQRGEVHIPLLWGYRREPLREGHDKQEGEEHLHPWESHPQLVEQFDDLAVAALLSVFRVPLLFLFTAHLSNILRHRCSLHPFEGLRWAISERGYPSAPIRAVLCRILGPGDTLRRERPLGWPPCHVQGSADRVDQEGDFHQAERFLHRRREWRGKARPGYRYWNFRELRHGEVRRILLPRTPVNRPRRRWSLRVSSPIHRCPIV
jgi:hypothetical protein